MCKRNIDWLPLTHPQLGVWPATQACALNHQPFSLQDDTQPTEHTSQLSSVPLNHTTRMVVNIAFM